MTFQLFVFFIFGVVKIKFLTKCKFCQFCDEQGVPFPSQNRLVFWFLIQHFHITTIEDWTFVNFKYTKNKKQKKSGSDDLKTLLGCREQGKISALNNTQNCYGTVSARHKNFMLPNSTMRMVCPVLWNFDFDFFVQPFKFLIIQFRQTSIPKYFPKQFCGQLSIDEIFEEAGTMKIAHIDAIKSRVTRPAYREYD